MPKIIKPAKGTFTTADITIDSSGRVIAAADGAGGGANMITKVLVQGPASGTYTAHPDATKFQAFLGGGGGGGGQGNGGNGGGNGGQGGFGFYTGSVSGGTAYSWSIGGGGGTNNSNSVPSQSGSAGGASNITNLAVANAGGAGSGAPNNGTGSPGAQGSAPGSDGNVSLNRAVLFAISPGVGSGGTKSNKRPQQTNPSSASSSNSGAAGALWLTEDAG